jgi:D-alanyl-D-alanine dipeptidase
MNIKELLNVFTDDVNEQIMKIEKINPLTDKIYEIELNRLYQEPIVKLIIKNKCTFLKIKFDDNCVEKTIRPETLDLIFKIKTQWENYVSNKSSYKSAFNELMEADEIFKHLEKMCEVTE